MGRCRQGWILGAAAACGLAAAPGARPAAREPSLQWQPLSGAQGDMVSALAFDGRTDRLAVGDARGVRVLVGGGSPRRILRRGPVRDVSFAARGALLAATDLGLFRVEADGRTVAVAPVPGSAGRAVRRISVSEVAIAIATEAGAFVSSDVQRWRRLSPALPARDATAIALRQRDGTTECFTVVDGRLWRVAWAAGEAPRASRQTLPFATGEDGPVDVVFGLPDADVVVVFPSSFALRDAPGASWRAVRPALPPGVRARRLVSARDRLWLATDRGLLTAATLAGPWVRAPRPLGTADVRSVVSDGAVIYVAADDRVHVARPPAAPLAAVLRTPEGDPAIQLVQQAALRYLDLRPDRIAALRRGVARRGWLPVMGLRMGYARDERRGVDHDEAFLSGAMRRLMDRDRVRERDFEALLDFTWDLGDTLYHPEEIDISREAREIIKLRDDVLDEVTQLYFERRQVLADLAAQPAAPAAEKLRLRLRAAELAAGIDAWTGGWFTRVRASGSP